MRPLWVALALFTLLALTGFGLMSFYVPSETVAAAPSTGHNPVTVGAVLRGMHFWVAQAVGPVILLHLLCLFARRGSHTEPRRVTMAIGLFLLTALLWFTGLLLPWDQLTYWLAAAGRDRGIHVSLLQIYWLHVALLPVLAGLTVFVYVRRLRKGQRSSSHLGMTV